MNPRELLRAMFEAAVAAAQPGNVLPAFLPPPPRGRTVVLGAGKAAAAMARVVEEHWRGPLEGLVVTRYGHGEPCTQVEVIEAGHPDPDAVGREGARRLLALAESLGRDDLALCLVSGGGSALLPLPLPPVTLAELQALNGALLRSGAAIGEINAVRRHLSAIQGGRLAAACHPARVVSLLLSDVPGDDPVDIASGPTVADPTSCADAAAVLARYGITPAPAIAEMLASGAGESVKPGDPRLAGRETHVVAAPHASLRAAAEVGRAAGFAVHILGDAIEGEAAAVGRALGGIALNVARRNEPFAAPCILLSGGETSVTVRGQGRGGRNVEFLLALGLALNGEAGVHALAADTDGVDGMEEIAGAWLAPDTLARARSAGLVPHDALADNDGHGFFGALGDSLVTGPTRTNVNDFRAILIEGRP